MQPSDLTTTSLGRLSRRPWKLLATTVMLPSGSCRVTRRLSCSHAISLPCRSRVRPLARFVGSSRTDTPPPGSYFMRRLLWMSLNSRWRPSFHHSGPSAGPWVPPNPSARCWMGSDGEMILSSSGASCSIRADDARTPDIASLLDAALSALRQDGSSGCRRQSRSPAACSVAGDFPKYRPLLPDALSVGLELPAGKFVAPAPFSCGSGGATDRLRTGLHRRRLCRAFEQAPTLRRAIRTQISVAGFVADRRDHLGAASNLCSGRLFPALETAVETQLRAGVGVFVTAATIRHYRGSRLTVEPPRIRSISSIVAP